MTKTRADEAWMMALADAFCLELEDAGNVAAERCLSQLAAASQVLSDALGQEAFASGHEAWRQTLDPCVYHALLMLEERGRVAECPELLRAIFTQRERRGFHRVSLIAAEPLDERQKAEIAAHLKKILGGDVTLEERIDPRVLGGFKLEAGSWSYDATLRHRLKQLFKALDPTVV